MTAKSTFKFFAFFSHSSSNWSTW